MPSNQLLGIVALCRVRYVYAADRLSIMLLANDGSETGDDITLRLPCMANYVVREGDPPLLALRLFDPSADRGRSSLSPGPCPKAARAVQKLLATAVATVVHIPIEARRDWLNSLVPGVTLTGNLYLLSQRPTPLDPDDDDPPAITLDDSFSLAHQLVQAGHASFPHDKEQPHRRAG